MSPAAATITVSILIFICIPSVSLTSQTDAIKKLQNYGYLSSSTAYSSTASASSKDLANGIREFQRIANIPQTGALDSTTLNKLNSKRCGDSDDHLVHVNRKRRDYSGIKWSRTSLTYKVYNSPGSMTLGQVRTTARKAFDIWADNSALKFEEKTGNEAVDIEIHFFYSAHAEVTGDPDFDGRGGQLAHAYLPNTGSVTIDYVDGDVHLDAAELWTINYSSTATTDLMWVLLHELGHSLGFTHSDDTTSVMYPYYQGYKAIVQLNAFDTAIRNAVYGASGAVPVAAPTQAPTTTTTPAPTPAPTLAPRTTPTPAPNPAPAKSCFSSIFFCLGKR